jgi:hypothetical protein
MSGKRFWVVFPLWIVLALPLPAATISFLVIETGLRKDMGSAAYSALWENSLLNVFFDAGHIVSNAPLMRLEHSPEEDFPPEAQVDLSEALGGGADFFVLVRLDYWFPSSGGGPVPRNVVLRIYRARPYGLIHEERLENSEVSPGRDGPARTDQIVRRLIPYIKD